MPRLQRVRADDFGGRKRICGGRSLDVQDAERMEFLHLHIVGDQQLFQMLFLARPRSQSGLQGQRFLLEPDEEVADDVGMLGEEQRRYDIAGMGALHIGTAHPMEKRDAIIAGHAHDHAIFEQAKAGTLG